MNLNLLLQFSLNESYYHPRAGALQEHPAAAQVGAIGVSNRLEGGAIFEITLPQA